ncbi:hypothetical protein [Flavobacterium fluviale]|uniref:Uncharacterized protein n=1 Tax=Flavobacterium fluviale TaxID=2249356 RepID=A0A344LR35_9FLAO|nr:hypothetical protein [Flavobacterium fluviale]AXB56377.1 hypothetical protein HYN86_07075 [Flavobacterium fluviale]
MKSKLKITIPEPCHESWDKMTPDATGRFCLVCNKSVIDFTNKLPDEIQHFFRNNKDQEVCGRFKKSQLDSISLQIPKQVLYSQTQYHKMFLLALFIAMGTTLFSCADKDGNKKCINNIEIIEEEETQDMGAPITIDSTNEESKKRDYIMQNSLVQQNEPLPTSHANTTITLQNRKDTLDNIYFDLNLIDENLIVDGLVRTYE